jgi:hypothetical protein
VWEVSPTSPSIVSKFLVASWLANRVDSCNPKSFHHSAIAHLLHLFRLFSCLEFHLFHFSALILTHMIVPIIFHWIWQQKFRRLAGVFYVSA